jgi:hypothetical protein
MGCGKNQSCPTVQPAVIDALKSAVLANDSSKKYNQDSVKELVKNLSEGTFEFVSSTNDKKQSVVSYITKINNKDVMVDVIYEPKSDINFIQIPKELQNDTTAKESLIAYVINDDGSVKGRIIKDDLNGPKIPF